MSSPYAHVADCPPRYEPDIQSDRRPERVCPVPGWERPRRSRGAPDKSPGRIRGLIEPDEHHRRAHATLRERQHEHAPALQDAEKFGERWPSILRLGLPPDGRGGVPSRAPSGAETLARGRSQEVQVSSAPNRKIIVRSQPTADIMLAEGTTTSRKRVRS